MAHNPNQVLMGTVYGEYREVVPHRGTIAAGTIVRRKSDGTLTTTKADGEFFGVSLGRDLSNAGYSAICVKGLGVPVMLKSGYNPTIGATVEVDDSSGLATGDGSKTATAATFRTGRIGGSGVNGGVQEDGSSVGVALIDMPGGL